MLKSESLTETGHRISTCVGGARRLDVEANSSNSLEGSASSKDQLSLCSAEAKQRSLGKASIYFQCCSFQEVGPNKPERSPGACMSILANRIQ